MKFDKPLIEGILLKRYKRFLADVKLNNGQYVTAHCPNSGSMKTCKEPSWKVLVSESDNPNRIPFRHVKRAPLRVFRREHPGFVI